MTSGLEMRIEQESKNIHCHDYLYIDGTKSVQALNSVFTVLLIFVIL